MSLLSMPVARIARGLAIAEDGGGLDSGDNGGLHQETIAPRCGIIKSWSGPDGLSPGDPGWPPCIARVPINMAPEPEDKNNDHD